MLEGLLSRSRDPKRIAYYEEELALPEFPLALLYLWGAYTRMSNRRGSNGYSVNPISYLEIDAFCRLTGQRFSPWEVRLIEDLDTLFMVEQGKQHQE